MGRYSEGDNSNLIITTKENHFKTHKRDLSSKDTIQHIDLSAKSGIVAAATNREIVEIDGV